MKKHIMIYLVSYFVLSSCYTDRHFDEIEEYLKGKSYLEINKTDSGYIFYQSCDASIRKIRFNKGLYFDFGQEDHEFEKWKIKAVEKDSIKIAWYYKDEYGNINESTGTINIILDTVSHLLYENGIVYIDSLYSNNIPTYEQPCIECYPQNECLLKDYNKSLRKKGVRRDRVPKAWLGSWQSDYRPYGFEISLSLEQDKITYNGINDLNQSYFSVRCQYKEVNDELHLYYDFSYTSSDDIHGTEFKLDTTPLLKLYRKDGNLYATDLQHFKIDSLELYEY